MKLFWKSCGVCRRVEGFEHQTARRLMVTVAAYCVVVGDDYVRLKLAYLLHHAAQSLVVAPDTEGLVRRFREAEIA